MKLVEFDQELFAASCEKLKELGYPLDDPATMKAAEPYVKLGSIITIGMYPNVTDQATVTSLRQASQHKTQSPKDPTDTSQVVRMRTRPSRSRQALEMHTEAVKGKTSLLLRYLLQQYTTYILSRVQGMVVGYEVIRARV